MTPKGQHLFELYTRLSYVRVASYTPHTLPCLKTKLVAVKVISKDQQPLKNNSIKDHYMSRSKGSVYGTSFVD